MIELEFLKEQNVSESLIHGIEEFRKNYNVDEGAAARVTRPSIPFYGKEILEMAIAGLLEGEGGSVLKETAFLQVFRRVLLQMGWHDGG